MSINRDTGFNDFRDKLLSLDPCWWAEHYLTIDGKPLKINGGGYKPFSDIYRYIGIKALEPNSLPVLLVKGRQVGATVTAATMSLWFMTCGFFGTNGKPPVRVFHLFPMHEMAQKYVKEKLNPMINSSLRLGESNKGQATRSYIQSFLDRSSDTGDSLGFKSFQNGNFIRIDSTGLDGNRLRGGSADIMFWDEVQDISASAINNTVEMLKQAQHGRVPGGVQVYFGTPKRKGSDFYKMWNVSSQQYFYLGCENCKEHFPLYTPGSDDWEKVWIHGFIVKCPKCGFEQDKREAAERGRWVSTKDDNDSDVRYIGFFMNQLFMPTLKKEDIIAEKPGIHPTNTERKFQNEVLGEFFQGDSSPITPEEIITACGDRERGIRAGIKPGEESMVVLGIDYGAKSDLEALADPNRARNGQSYTTAVVMSVKGPNLFNIDLALKFVRNDPESKKKMIDQIMRQYSVDICVGDIGFSNDFSHTMHTIYGDRYLVSRAHNRINGKIKFNADAYPKEIIFERDYFIGEMFELLKKGQIKFPLKDYDRIAWLIDQCSSMELKPSLSRGGGDPEIHYVKSGTSGNDGLMSILNCYLAYKYYVTGGFKIRNPNLMNKTIDKDKGRPLAIAGNNIRRRF